MNTRLLDLRHLIAQKGRFDWVTWWICCAQGKLQTHEHVVRNTKHPHQKHRNGTGIKASEKHFNNSKNCWVLTQR